MQASERPGDEISGWEWSGWEWRDDEGIETSSLPETLTHADTHTLNWTVFSQYFPIGIGTGGSGGLVGYSPSPL